MRDQSHASRGKLLPGPSRTGPKNDYGVDAVPLTLQFMLRRKLAASVVLHRAPGPLSLSNVLRPSSYTAAVLRKPALVLSFA
jgi:hypothetical protein